MSAGHAEALQFECSGDLAVGWFSLFTAYRWHSSMSRARLNLGRQAETRATHLKETTKAIAWAQPYSGEICQALVYNMGELGSMHWSIHVTDSDSHIDVLSLVCLFIRKELLRTLSYTLPVNWKGKITPNCSINMNSNTIIFIICWASDSSIVS